jgi:hypothetical protein
MRLLCFISLIILFPITHGDDLEKYRSLREQCQRNPTNSECLNLKSKFLQLIAKCQNLLGPQQIIVCQEVKMKLCAVFPSTCAKVTTKPPTSTKQGKITKRKLVTTTTTEKAKPVITTPGKAKSITTTTTRKSEIIITTTQSEVNPSETITNEEFVKVPINPDDLRIRGEYCVRHGKEKKCQQLLTNLKNTYSTCSKKKAEPQPERIDCHSFQTHLCKAFPKFPPCIKKTPT